MNEKDYYAYKSPNLVKETPTAFKKWVKNNAKKLSEARDNGKLPYFVRDNEKGSRRFARMGGAKSCSI